MEQNYLPLFRKYRPQSFKDVVGQENLVKALTNAIELNRIANAYLFCGPRGTGKTSSARILAKSLNCEHGPTLEPCQKCASCIDITNTTGLDVIEIDAASNRGIQDAKDLIAQVQYAPINGKYKIFIIDEVHMLTSEAFNALLKTLEEPPKNVIFILATTEPHKVLETIVSRCQRFDLRRITTEDIKNRLREISDIENIKITDDALYAIAKNVSGGLRDSLALLDQVSILGVKEEISKDLIEELLGKINFNVLLELLINITSEDIEKTLVSIENIYTKGNEPRNLAENFIEFLRNVILVANSNNPQTVKNFTTLIDENIEKIQNANFDKDNLVKILNTLIEYYKEIKVSTNPYLWMELAAIACCKLELVNSKTVNIQQSQIIEKPQVKEIAMQMQAPIPTKTPISSEVQIQTSAQIKKTEPNEHTKVASEVQTPTQVPTQAPMQSATPVPAEIAANQDSAQIWANILGAIPSIVTRSFLSQQARLLGIENNVIKLGFVIEALLAKMKAPDKYDTLEATVKKLYPNYGIELLKVSSDVKYISVKPNVAISRPPQQNISPAQNVSALPQNQALNKQNEQEENDEEMQNEKKHYSPKVQEMIEQFSGKIID